jgi:hypothetical protein
VYAYQAARRNFQFSLSREEFAKITSGSCAYCGQKPSMTRTGSSSSEQSKYVYNGVDRMDNTKGYTVENTASACKRCQFSKRDMSVEDFKAWINAVHAHLPNWP